MNPGVGRVLYESIIEKKWIDISYINSDGSESKFWVAIYDIPDRENHILSCRMVNYKAGYEEVKTVNNLKADKIVSATILNGTRFECNSKLLESLTGFPQRYDWLETKEYNFNVLKYLGECCRYDTNPYIDDDECKNIVGLNFNDFRGFKARLSEETLKQFVKIILQVNESDAVEKSKQSEICLSNLAISIKHKKFIIAYRKIEINFDSRTAIIDSKSSINKEFLIEGKKHYLLDYCQCDPEEFIEHYDENPYKYKELIKQNLSANEKIDTREEVYILKREPPIVFDKISNSIEKMSEDECLTNPIKSYFGRNYSSRKDKNNNPYIVIKDKYANPDQVRVIYNAMTDYVTYVEGPPGTGKTKTIVNVILSAIANNQTCLVCSNNNKPIDDIYDSIHFIHKDSRKVLFPIIRIGNKEANIEALQVISNLYQEVLRIKDDFESNEEIENYKVRSLSMYESLKSELDKSEQFTELMIKQESLNELKARFTDGVPEVVSSELENVNKELSKCSFISDSQIVKHIYPAEENEDYLNYLYYSSLSFVKRLLSAENNDLISIIRTEDKDEANKAFNKYLNNDESLMRFLSVFPVVLTTNLSAAKLGSAFPHFDLCIMDEASQCNIATSLISIIRAQSLLLIGDVHQLKPVIVLEEKLNKKLMAKYNICESYNYLNQSVLSLMTKVDKLSKYIKLRYHYRCPKSIIDFCNKLFYSDSLIMENHNDASFEYVNVENNNKEETDNAYEAEAKAIVDLIKDRKYDNAVVITPFKNQADLINTRLKEEGVDNIEAGTIHTVQGKEKKVVIFSTALSLKTAQKTYEWLKNNTQLINVGVSRAKKEIVVVGDYQIIKALDKGQNTVLSQLVDYVRSKGDISTVKPTPIIRRNLSNASLAEKEVYDTLAPLFKTKRELSIERNVKVSKALDIPSDDYKRYYYRAEFDFVIFKKMSFGQKRPELIIEVDGDEHIYYNATANRDRKKEIICNEQKITILRIHNSDARDYDSIITMLCKTLGIEKPKTVFGDMRGNNE